MRFLALPLLLCAVACDRRADVGPVVVSAIGATPRLAATDRGVQDTPDRILLGARAQGLVAFDAAGQIVPALAERWIVFDDGRSYIFRLGDARWADGRRVDAREVATALKRQFAPRRRNPLAPFLSAIDDVVAMTDSVVEIRLSRPRPDLLTLFAQPELAIRDPKRGEGSGPFRAGADGLLSLIPDETIGADEPESLIAEDRVRLIGERAARAIVRFAARESDMVAGGTVTDWPMVALADIAPASVRIDPAAGLFGLVVADRSGFLADPAARGAIAQAIDRAALAATVAPEWDTIETILPARLDAAADPAAPDWSAQPMETRRSVAAAVVRRIGSPVVLRIALPVGPGGTLLWGRLAADLRAIGIHPLRVGWTAPTDLRLIDAVAPYESARWYLATACAPCGEEASAAIEAARIAPTLAARAQALAQADAALTADGAFIPLARPFRWSLVATRLRAWQPNPRAWHPLNDLRRDPR